MYHEEAKEVVAFAFKVPDGDIDPASASKLADMAKANGQVFGYFDDAEIPLADILNPVPGR